MSFVPKSIFLHVYNPRQSARATVQLPSSFARGTPAAIRYFSRHVSDVTRAIAHANYVAYYILHKQIYHSQHVMMTTAVASTPIKVELIEECSFVKETKEENSSSFINKTDDDTQQVEKTNDKSVSKQGGAKCSGKNKATRPVLPELVIADTELFVKTLSDVVSDVLSQPTLLPPDAAPSSNKPEKSRATQDFQRTCYKTPSPSPASSSSSSEQNTASPLSAEQHQTGSSDPLKLGSGDSIKHGSHDSDQTQSPSSRPSSTEPGGKRALKERINSRGESRTTSPECHTENIRQSQQLSVKLDPDSPTPNTSFVPKQHLCFSCGKIFSQKLHLQRHIKSVHYGIRDNLCAFCGKGFMLKSHLMEHIRAVHFKIKNHVCLFCDWKFNRIGDLNRHVKTVHTNGKKPRKRRSQPKESSEMVYHRVISGKEVPREEPRDEHGIIDVVSDGSDADYSRDSALFDQPLSSNNDNSMSPTEQAPLSLTDRYLSDYKKRLLEMENERGEKNGNSGSEDLEIQEDEIVLFPSS
ncbi:hypothetical protein ACHWQZ_G015015 [Mnemiopsis leidyi]